MNVEGPESTDGTAADLLIIAIGGVQRFIDESRTTADLRAGSEIFGRLAAEATRVLAGLDGVRLVFPAAPGSGAVLGVVEDPRGTAGVSRGVGVPNRVVALVPSSGGAEASDGDGLAAVVVAAVEDLWRSWVRETFGRAVETPGMPSVQWVRVSAGLATIGTSGVRVSGC